MIFELLDKSPSPSLDRLCILSALLERARKEENRRSLLTIFIVSVWVEILANITNCPVE
jgi:hypothetical protein